MRRSQLTGSALLLLALGCNVIASREASIRDTLTSASLTPHTVVLGEDTVHYWQGGKGPTVLLVHGFGASAMWQWYKQAEALAAHHRLIVPDLPWFGATHSTSRDFSLDHAVRMLHALLGELGERQVDVVGISYGGLVTVELANAHPELIGSMVIVDSPGRVYGAADYARLCKRFGVDDIAKVLVPSSEDDIGTLLDIAYFDPPWVPGFARRQTLDHLYGRHREEQTALLKTALGSMAELKARPTTYRGRALVVWGRGDRVFPLSVGRRLSKSLGARLEVIEKARHAPNLEHPDVFNEVLVRFLGAP